jgi:hypothetical protein
MIYQIFNETDDECVFLLGTFLEKDLALKTAKELDPENIERIYDDFAKLRVEEVKIGMTGAGFTILKIEWNKKYDDENDDCPEWVMA